MKQIVKDHELLEALIKLRYGNDIDAEETYYWNGAYTFPKEIRDLKSPLDKL